MFVFDTTVGKREDILCSKSMKNWGQTERVIMLPPVGKATLLSWSLQEQARLRDTWNYIIEEFENPLWD